MDQSTPRPPRSSVGSFDPMPHNAAVSGARSAAARARGYPSLLRCRDQANKIAARRGSGPRFEDHSLALDRQETEQRPNGQGVSYEHERAGSAPSRYYFLQLQKAYRSPRVPVRNKGPRAFNRADSHQAGSLQAAAPRRRHDPVHAHAVVAEGLAKCSGFCAPLFVQVPLRLAVVDLETGRVAAVAGGRVAVSDQCNVASLDERAPGLLRITGGQARRDA